VAGLISVAVAQDRLPAAVSHNWVPLASAEPGPPVIEVESAPEKSQIRVYFSLNGFEWQEVALGDTVCARVASAGSAVTCERGLPEVPYFIVKPALPDGSEPAADRIEKETVTFSCARYLHSKGPRPLWRVSPLLAGQRGDVKT